MPARKSRLQNIKLNPDGDSLPSWIEARRYIISWFFVGIALASAISLGWTLIGGTSGIWQRFPWSSWFVIAFLCVAYAAWNLWYICKLVAHNSEVIRSTMQDKRTKEEPRERLFLHLIQTATNIDQLSSAARISAILRIPDYVLSRGQSGDAISRFYRSVGTTVICSIMTELSMTEREQALDRTSQLIKKAALQAILDMKEHLQSVMLQEADLSGLDMSFANFAGANLQYTSFHNAKLDEINFQGACLEFCDLQKANLLSAEFHGANLQHAILCDANLSNARMKNAKLQHANLQQAMMPKVDLSEAMLIGANLQFVNLQEAQLRFANLQGADLRGASLIHADLEGADLEGVDLTGADLTGARLQGARLPS
jgi:uncharacterized protein YjbI with pentapeptide repeats